MHGGACADTGECRYGLGERGCSGADTGRRHSSRREEGARTLVPRQDCGSSKPLAEPLEVAANLNCAGQEGHESTAARRVLASARNRLTSSSRTSGGVPEEAATLPAGLVRKTSTTSYTFVHSRPYASVHVRPIWSVVRRSFSLHQSQNRRFA